jgi:hypothetical protein
MPIFEYSCDDCGDADAVRCPGCGHDHLTTEYSTFAARAGSSKSAEPAGGCGAAACGQGRCGSGMCGMNMN